MFGNRRIGQDLVAHLAVGDDILAQPQLFGITAVIGSTFDVSTSPSCSTQPRILLSSGLRRSASSSLIAMRAKDAMRSTV